MEIKSNNKIQIIPAKNPNSFLKIHCCIMLHGLLQGFWGMFHCTFTSFVASQTISQTFTMITTGGRLPCHKLTYFMRILTNFLSRIFFLDGQRSSSESYIQSL